MLMTSLGAFAGVRYATGGTVTPVSDAQPAPPGLPQPQPSAAAGAPPTNLPANPDTSKAGWHLPYLEANRQKPTTNKTINGITVGPSAKHPPAAQCRPGTAKQVALEQAAGTPENMTPKYLPAGASVFEALATTCQNASGQTVVIATDIGITIASDSKAGKRGGVVSM